MSLIIRNYWHLVGRLWRQCGIHFTLTRKKSVAWSRCIHSGTKILTDKSSNYTQQKAAGQKTDVDASKVRNIGIVAHIDAGKTTTTERMLYYSGLTSVMGEVHDGDTVMDYMEQERARGITITSAAITFPWNGHRFNLIDTPGHVDFTIEVERSLRVLDGAITILDACSGVEAQTVTVWRQADKYKIPRIVYLNKMDRPNADVNLCLNSMKEKLDAVPLLIHMPVSSQGAFRGIVDLVTMEKLTWNPQADRSGTHFQSHTLTEKDGKVFEEASILRMKLVGHLADLDDELTNSILELETMEAVSAEDIGAALRRVTMSGVGVPTLCGSSYKNVGVQPLLNAVIKYLPSPKDCKFEMANSYGNELCALAFKIIHDKQKGRLIFLRVYSGKLVKDQRLYIPSRNSAEKISHLMVAYADEFKNADVVNAGNIAVVSGLKNIISGDTVVSSSGAFKNAQDVHRRKIKNGGNANMRNEEAAEELAVLGGIQIPDPVFFCSIEAASLVHQKFLDTALENLKAEDPSFQVSFDEDTGQTVISGMGELHIEIMKERIEKEYKVDAYLGPLQVAYKEVPTKPVMLKHTLDKTIDESKSHVVIALSLEPSEVTTKFTNVKMAYSRENQENLASIKKEYLQAINHGILQALTHGPLTGSQVIDAIVRLHWFETAPRTSKLMVSACSAQCITEMLSQAELRLMEPYMFLEITTDENYMHGVLGDLNRRRGKIAEIIPRPKCKVVRAYAPVADLMGYSTTLRTVTSGTATFTMEFHSYQSMSTVEQKNAIFKLTGVI